MILDAFRSALQSIIVNKLRSALTMLGVIIGVASVIALVAVGNGASQRVQNSIQSLGSNLVTVTPQAGTSQGLAGAGAVSQSLTLADSTAIADQLGSSIVASEAEQSAGRWQVVVGAQNWNTSVTGVTADYPTVRDWNTSDGAFFTASDLSRNAQVAVIGATTAANLFVGGSAAGQTIELRQAATDQLGNAIARTLSFKILGVLEVKGSTGGFSRDDMILVPLSTAQDVLTGQRTWVSTIVIKAASSKTMAATTTIVTNILLSRHKISDTASADFIVTNQNDTLAAVGSVTATFTILLAGIGGISLLVGGVGIMNIMLVSVNQRTREIGIRKAVGARRRDILAQFMVEAVVLTGLGGLLGVGVGWAITLLVHFIRPTFAVSVTVGTVIIAVGVSIAIGLVFGIYPAMRAARLQPVQALRND